MHNSADMLDKLVTIICPIYNEEKFIENCIESILLQDYSKNCLEVLFVDGMSTDNTRSIVERYVQKSKHIKLLDNVNKVVPYALNIGINSSKGDVVIRIDGHCIYPSNYISVLVNHLYELNADNVGAVWNTLPAKENSICKAIAIGSSHKFGVGGSKHKVGASEIIETDTVPFGCYRRDVFDKIGLFDEELVRNQDDEFNARLVNSGGKIYLIPDLVINYSARDSIEKMSRMYYQYGLFKPLVNRKLGKPATIRQFFPAGFLVGLIGGGILGFFSTPILIMYLAVLSLYLILAIAIAFKSFTKYKDWKLIFILPLVFFIIHISYGWGYWVGIYKILFNKKFIVSTNR